jgi:hypothetical protein
MIDTAPSVYRLEFRGPFGWTARDDVPCIFDSPEGKGTGLYLWTVAVQAGELAYYVGETSRTFAQRHLEHLKEHLAGAYHVHEPSAFRQGLKVELWPGHYGPRPRPSVADWLARYPSLTEAVTELAGIYRFFVAHVEWESRLRHRAEAAIASVLKGSAHSFQDEGGRYWTRRPSEPPVALEVTSASPILGLPSTLAA